LELGLLLGFFPRKSAKDKSPDRDGTGQLVLGRVLVDDGEEFNRETDFGCS
jgi:hypothetical protein